MASDNPPGGFSRDLWVSYPRQFLVDGTGTNLIEKPGQSCVKFCQNRCGLSSLQARIYKITYSSIVEESSKILRLRAERNVSVVQSTLIAKMAFTFACCA